ncbi:MULTISPECIES: HNH endonuclease signature motif containing protein [Rhodococcus]|uniref:HNH endonuclease signature motif containing protein n=1 Tax=Rhodococcus TaxID=1827 RepID=UPI000691BE24|nr:MULTISPECIES: HNH endonuclease signature motif containing protein [Rhodococcus]NRH33223.1 HNH endonuclease [Rhodococcus sp. MS13]
MPRQPHQHGSQPWMATIVTAMTPDERERLERRFTAKIVVDGTGCHMWQGAHNGRYPTLSLNGRTVYGHQLAWTLEHGRAIRPGHQIDHTCRTPLCVNPDHLDEITRRMNILLGSGPSARNAAKIFCDRGHPLFGDNLYTAPNGWRVCIMCRDGRNRKYAAKRKVAKLETAWLAEHGEATA